MDAPTRIGSAKKMTEAIEIEGNNMIVQISDPTMVVGAKLKSRFL